MDEFDQSFVFIRKSTPSRVPAMSENPSTPWISHFTCAHSRIRFALQRRSVSRAKPTRGASFHSARAGRAVFSGEGGSAARGGGGGGCGSLFLASLFAESLFVES